MSQKVQIARKCPKLPQKVQIARKCSKMSQRSKLPLFQKKMVQFFNLIEFAFQGQLHPGGRVPVGPVGYWIWGENLQKKN